MWGDIIAKPGVGNDSRTPCLRSAPTRRSIRPRMPAPAVSSGADAPRDYRGGEQAADASSSHGVLSWACQGNPTVSMEPKSSDTSSMGRSRRSPTIAKLMSLTLSRLAAIRAVSGQAVRYCIPSERSEFERVHQGAEQRETAFGRVNLKSTPTANLQLRKMSRFGLESRVGTKNWGGSPCRVECRDRSSTLPFSRPLASGRPHRRCSLGAY